MEPALSPISLVLECLVSSVLLVNGMSVPGSCADVCEWQWWRLLMVRLRDKLFSDLLLV